MNLIARMRGTERMVAKLLKLQQDFPDRVERAILQEAKIELTEAKRRTPVDTGTLRASGKVGMMREGRTIIAIFSFGGPAESYVVYVHERLDVFHMVGQAKFLESVLNESRAHMAKRIAKRIDLNNALLG